MVMVLDKINNILLSKNRFLSKKIDHKGLFLEYLKAKLKDDFLFSTPQIKVRNNFLKITFFGPLAPIVFEGEFLKNNGLEFKGSFKISTITLLIAIIFFIGFIALIFMNLINLININSNKYIFFFILLFVLFFLWDIFKWRRRVKKLKTVMVNYT